MCIRDSFTIIGEDSPEHIRYVAHLVDEKMQELGQKSAGLDTTRKATPIVSSS